MNDLIELDAGKVAEAGQSVADMARQGHVICLRAVPEIRVLLDAINGLAGRGSDVASLLEGRERSSLNALSKLYKTVRELRDSRFISGLFSDLLLRFGMPQPLLVDTAFCRMVVPLDYEGARSNPAMFAREEFEPSDPNGAEHMIQGESWGNAHRDIAVRHYHFQLNLWFPLHDVDETQSLLIFPDAYRCDARQYMPLGDRADPASWGFGRPLRVALRAGDILVFHAQHLHASPSQAPGKSRYTVELRAAAACMDDNARIYRRLFLNARNFGGAELATELIGTAPSGPRLEWVLDGHTAYAVIKRLFPNSGGAMRAAYVHCDDRDLDATIELNVGQWRAVVDRFESLSHGEDLAVLLARLLLRHGQHALAGEVLRSVTRDTTSYFWALEAGRVAAGAKMREVAVSAFEAAEELAMSSSVALDSYWPGKPLRSSTLQLLPREAARAAHIFARLARSRNWSSSFDHRRYWDPSEKPGVAKLLDSDVGRRAKAWIKEVAGRSTYERLARLFHGLG